MKVALHIVVVDDEGAQREILRDILTDAGHGVDTAASGADALERLEHGPCDLLITDLRMPGMDGVSLLAECRKRHGDLPVLLMTAYGTVSSAVEAMKTGAFDYLQKPFGKDELLQRVQRVAERTALLRENVRLREELGATAVQPLIGESAVLHDLRRRLARLAQVPGDVLVTGESGTGKELVARALHYGGARASGPFVPVNCAAIPEGLAESELFGHEKGSFTHATSARAGRFEQADGGTLFLDEISSMPLVLQAKLLRVLQERVVERVGGDKRRSVDVRVVAATNRDLPELCRAGQFREDLYHRLNVHELLVPPLRERAGDVAQLALYFRDRAAIRCGMPAPDLEPGLMEFLSRYSFPGNVRELEHMMEKMVVLSEGDPLGLADLPPSVRRHAGPDLMRAMNLATAQSGSSDGGVGTHDVTSVSGSTTAPAASIPAGVSAPTAAATNLPVLGPIPEAGPEALLDAGPISFFDVEERLLREAIRRANGNLSEAARQLGLSYKTLRYRARKFGLDG